MGNKNASSPHKQGCKEHNEDQLFKPNAYRASSSTDSRPRVSLAGEEDRVHSVALLHSVDNTLVSGGGGKVHFFSCPTRQTEQRAISTVLLASLHCMRPLCH